MEVPVPQELKQLPSAALQSPQRQSGNACEVPGLSPAPCKSPTNGITHWQYIYKAQLSGLEGQGKDTADLVQVPAE